MDSDSGINLADEIIVPAGVPGLDGSGAMGPEADTGVREEYGA